MNNLPVPRPMRRNLRSHGISINMSHVAWHLPSSRIELENGLLFSHTGYHDTALTEPCTSQSVIIFHAHYPHLVCSGSCLVSSALATFLSIQLVASRFQSLLSQIVHFALRLGCALAVLVFPYVAFPYFVGEVGTMTTCFEFGKVLDESMDRERVVRLQVLRVKSLKFMSDSREPRSYGPVDDPETFESQTPKRSGIVWLCTSAIIHSPSRPIAMRRQNCGSS